MKDEVLDMIEQCASAGMPVSDTCAICEIDENDYAESEAAQKRYDIGRLKTELAVRQSVVALAKKGDARMVKLYFDLTHGETSLTQEEIKEVLRLADAR